jgi:phage gp45-like
MKMYRAYLDANAKQYAFRQYKGVAVTGMTDQKLTVPIYQHYGLTSMPTQDSEAVVLVEGNNYVIIAEDHADRPEIEEGETKLYNSMAATSVYLDKEGNVTITGAGGSITLEGDSGDVVIHGTGTVRLDAGTKVMLGRYGEYVVTSPVPGQIVTQDGHILNAREDIVG